MRETSPDPHAFDPHARDPHARELGRRAIERFYAGDKEAAIADVQSIAPLSNEVVDLLDRLIAEYT